ncbi:MAG: flagellar biosynthetic protein FliO [Sandaracinaceae bacterium]
MSRGLTASAVLIALTLPSVALAENRFIDARGGLNDEAFEVSLRAGEALGRPQVRTEPGFVRVWFPNMRAARFDIDGDGAAVRFVHVRPGIEDSAVAIVRLGDMRRLPEEAVTVTVEGTGANLRIARVALPRPAAAPTPSVAPVNPSDAAGANAANANEANANAANANANANNANANDANANNANANNANANAANAANANANHEASATNANDADANDANPNADSATNGASDVPLALTRTDALTLPASSGPSTMMILAVLCLLLGAAYVAIKMIEKRKKGPQPDIEIIAHKRLGARHQLLVVRALGEDHLLAVQQGRTERLASIPAQANSDADDDRDGGATQDDDPLPFLKLNKEDRDGGRTLHRRQVEERPRFGADLMRLALERNRNDRVSVPAVTAAPSDAIAGLLRLREKLGR